MKSWIRLQSVRNSVLGKGLTLSVEGMGTGRFFEEFKIDLFVGFK